MSDRGWLTIGISIFVLSVLGLVALVVPKSRRIFWILGLSLALLEFGAITIGIAVQSIRHKHLNTHGILFFLANGCVAWMIAEYLHKKIKEQNSGLRENTA